MTQIVFYFPDLGSYKTLNTFPKICRITAQNMFQKIQYSGLENPFNIFYKIRDWGSNQKSTIKFRNQKKIFLKNERI